jgi:hypothetical protein
MTFAIMIADITIAEFEERAYVMGLHVNFTWKLEKKNRK